MRNHKRLGFLVAFILTMNVLLEGQVIIVSIKSPAPNAIISGPMLSIQVAAISDYQLRDILAKVEGVSDSLTNVGAGLFEGSLQLAGLTPGTKTLSVEATDIFNHTASDSVLFVFSPPPALILLSTPESETHVGNRGNVIVSASGIARPITVSVYLNDKLVDSSQDTIRTILDFSQYHGTISSIKLKAVDSRLQSATTNITVYVDTTSSLLPLLTMPNRILDFNDWFVISGNGSSIQVYDLATNVLSQIELPFPDILRVTATVNGFIAVTSGYPNNYKIYEWNGSELIKIAEISPSDYADISVVDTFVVWGVNNSPGPKFVRKNLLTNDTVQFTGGVRAGNNTQSLAANGGYAFWADYNIYLYDGQIKQITSDGSLNTMNVYPVTDGKLVAYKKSGPVSPSIVLYDGQSSVNLASNIDFSSSNPPLDYCVNHGYVAFADKSSLGERNIFLRNIDGTIQQLTFYGNMHNPYIEDMTPKGSVIIKDGNERILFDKSGSSQVIASTLGQISLMHGAWYISLGKDLLKNDVVTSVLTDHRNDMNPMEYSLSQNFPNPFNPVTSISFSLPRHSFVSLIVFDVLGKEIERVVFEELSAGKHVYLWNASRFSSGVYFYRLQAGTFVENKKLILLK